MKFSASCVLLACTALAAAVPAQDQEHERPTRSLKLEGRAAAKNVSGLSALKLPTALPYNTKAPVSAYCHYTGESSTGQS